MLDYFFICLFSSRMSIWEFQARFCVRGRELLYKYCSERGIPHKKTGKLIVATGSSDVPKLNGLMIRGSENGVCGLRMLEGFEAMEMEPELQCVRALLSPASGIVDTHSLMLSLVVSMLCLFLFLLGRFLFLVKKYKRLLSWIKYKEI